MLSPMPSPTAQQLAKSSAKTGALKALRDLARAPMIGAIQFADRGFMPFERKEQPHRISSVLSMNHNRFIRFRFFVTPSYRDSGTYG